MPRGFLVKRLQKHSAPVSYRVRRYSDEDRSDSSSDHDGPEGTVTSAPHASPDSGFSSPTLLLTLKCPQSPSLPEDRQRGGCIPSHHKLPGHHLHYHPRHSPFTNRHEDDSISHASANNNKPLALITRSEPPSLTPNLQSPFYLAGFDRLAVTPTTPTCRSTQPSTPSLPPPSPHKKRLGDQDQGERNHRPKPAKKSKAVRRLNFDEDKSSPVSGTIIRELGDDEDLLVVRKGDIDPTFNVVEVTEEAKAEIAKIENRIGDYICQLCRTMYDDAFGLAQHRCSRIVHVEYRCPECDKVFNCPANLASHRRWHKPRVPPGTSPAVAAVGLASSELAKAASTPTTPSSEAAAAPVIVPQLQVKIEPSDTESSSSSLPGSPHSESGSQVAQGLMLGASDEMQFECEFCRKRFRRWAYLRKHMAVHGAASSATPSGSGEDAEREQRCSSGDLALRYILSALSSTAPSSSSPASSPSSESHHHHQHHYPHHVHSNHLAAEPPNLSSSSSASSSPSPQNDMYACKHCLVTFSSSPGLTRHVNKHHPSESRQVILLQLASNAIRNAAAVP